MAHLHSVYDSDMHFSIDPITREIRNESSKKTLVQYDHNSERFTFELPRYIEGHDMLLCNRVEVHFINIGKNGEHHEGVYEVDDWQKSPEDDGVAIYSWLISANATQYVGSLNFLIRFACEADDGTIDYAWHTKIFKDMSVSDGMNHGEAVVENYLDILEKWRRDLIESGSGVTVTVDDHDYASHSPDEIKKLIDMGKVVTLRKYGSVYNLYGVFDTYIMFDMFLMFGDKTVSHVIQQVNENKSVLEIRKYTDNVEEVVDEKLTAAKESGEFGVQTDWNQNDPTAADYMKNRPFYESDPVKVTVVPEGTFALEGGIYQGELLGSPLTANGVYTVVLNGVTYSDLTCVDFNGFPALGSPDIMDSATTEYPFLIITAENAGTKMLMIICGAEQITLSVIGGVRTITKLDSKFLPEEVISRVGISTEGKVFTIDGEEVTAEIGAEIFNMYSSNIATGGFSHAEGGDTRASGVYAHSEGFSTIASGDESHAEGYYTESSGTTSHSEGSNTIASGSHSHAEGFYSESTGDSSHAEGEATKASGFAAHAEGYYTRASGGYSHVQGKYNIEDSAGKYAHIVGNGNNNEHRSNAHTLDWDGNAWFAGGIELTSPNGTRYRFTVADDGTLSAVQVTE